MHLVRYTIIIDRSGGVSFVAPSEAYPAFAAAANNPTPPNGGFVYELPPEWSLVP